MIHIILYQPEIPPNTGNIIRLAANTGSSLTLIRPLGFQLDDAKLRRAGLDYRERTAIQVCDSLEEVLHNATIRRIYALTTKGRKCLSDVSFEHNDGLLFGPETRGLPQSVREQFRDTCIRIPMRPDSRSLNLSNAVAVAVYEAWRQLGFPGKYLN